jgi:hypothetical protein
MQSTLTSAGRRSWKSLTPKIKREIRVEGSYSEMMKRKTGHLRTFLSIQELELLATLTTKKIRILGFTGTGNAMDGVKIPYLIEKFTNIPDDLLDTWIRIGKYEADTTEEEVIANMEIDDYVEFGDFTIKGLAQVLLFDNQHRTRNVYYHLPYVMKDYGTYTTQNCIGYQVLLLEYLSDIDIRSHLPEDPTTKEALVVLHALQARIMDVLRARGFIP